MIIPHPFFYLSQQNHKQLEINLAAFPGLCHLMKEAGAVLSNAGDHLHNSKYKNILKKDKMIF